MRNKLAPGSPGDRFVNFLLNAFWAIVWLGRAAIRCGRWLMSRLR
jgi:hypothetical protein